MITKFKIFESEDSIWSEIYSDFIDYDEIYIDAYKADRDEGRTIAKIDILRGNVIYIDRRAKTDSFAQEVIKDAINDITEEQRIEIKTRKYNI
jgi:hypothetical protein